jgi:hypothetical protein
MANAGDRKVAALGGFGEHRSVLLRLYVALGGDFGRRAFEYLRDAQLVLV